VDEQSIVIGGIVVPLVSPLFVALVVVHVFMAIGAVLVGAGVMLTDKGTTRHVRLGTLYYWTLAVVCASAFVLAMLRWTHDRVLFALAIVSFAAATWARWAVRRRRLKTHVATIAASYVVMLIAFYVDNGPNLPIWRDLPAIAYWLLPIAIGLPLTARAIRTHPLINARQRT
jgi:uncharacterized membrane protein